jgi:hypothetical protein
MSPYREPSPTSEPRSFEEVTDRVLVHLLGSSRVFYSEFKDAFAFEDAQKEAERLITLVDPGAVVILTVTPSAHIQQRLDTINRSRAESNSAIDSAFAAAVLLQQEWEMFFAGLDPKERTAIESLGEQEQISAFVKGRRGVKGTYLRWLTKF